MNSNLQRSRDDAKDDDDDDDDDDEEEEYKMVLVVRTDLNMTKGKIVAQCCHAAVSVVSDLLHHSDKKILDAWEESGSTKVGYNHPFSYIHTNLNFLKIALKAPNLDEIIKIYKEAKSSNIPTDYIQDAGRTQIPEGSVTVVAVGPGK